MKEDADRGAALLQVASDWYHNAGDAYLGMVLALGPRFLSRFSTLVIQMLLNTVHEDKDIAAALRWNSKAPYIEAIRELGERLCGEKLELYQQEDTWWGARTVDFEKNCEVSGWTNAAAAVGALVLMVREEKDLMEEVT